jgi:hypothetical protein
MSSLQKSNDFESSCKVTSQDIDESAWTDMEFGMEFGFEPEEIGAFGDSRIKGKNLNPEPSQEVSCFKAEESSGKKNGLSESMCGGERTSLFYDSFNQRFVSDVLPSSRKINSDSMDTVDSLHRMAQQIQPVFSRNSEYTNVLEINQSVGSWSQVTYHRFDCS